MKRILTATAIALSTGLMISPAIANDQERPPRSIQVDADDSARATEESATHLENARERQRMAQPLEELPKENARRYEQK